MRKFVVFAVLLSLIIYSSLEYQIHDLQTRLTEVEKMTQANLDILAELCRKFKYTNM